MNQLKSYIMHLNRYKYINNINDAINSIILICNFYFPIPNSALLFYFLHTSKLIAQFNLLSIQYLLFIANNPILQLYTSNNNKQMDKTFNFFKTKVKKENQRPRNNSKSNSSKVSYSRNSDKIKPSVTKHPPLTKKQREIREAIEFRYQKSKLRTYRFQRLDSPPHRQVDSSHSSQMQQYRHLKKQNIVDIRQYLKKQQTQTHSNNSSQEKKKFNLRFKLKDNSTKIMKTQGNDSSEKNPYLNKIAKHITPTKISKKADEWKFISIQIKENLSKPKNRKTEVKINSHRSYNMPQDRQQKLKSNSSMNKYLDKAAKLDKLSRTKV